MRTCVLAGAGVNHWQKKKEEDHLSLPPYFVSAQGERASSLRLFHLECVGKSKREISHVSIKRRIKKNTLNQSLTSGLSSHPSLVSSVYSVTSPPFYARSFHIKARENTEHQGWVDNLGAKKKKKKSHFCHSAHRWGSGISPETAEFFSTQTFVMVSSRILRTNTSRLDVLRL